MYGYLDKGWVNGAYGNLGKNAKTARGKIRKGGLQQPPPPPPLLRERVKYFGGNYCLVRKITWSSTSKLQNNRLNLEASGGGVWPIIITLRLDCLGFLFLLLNPLLKALVQLLFFKLTHFLTLIKWYFNCWRSIISRAFCVLTAKSQPFAKNWLNSDNKSMDSNFFVDFNLWVMFLRHLEVL